MLPFTLSALFLVLILAAFVFGIYHSVKKSKNGGCSGCSGCPSANKCDKNQKNQ